MISPSRAMIAPNAAAQAGAHLLGREGDGAAHELFRCLQASGPHVRAPPSAACALPADARRRAAAERRRPPRSPPAPCCRCRGRRSGRSIGRADAARMPMARRRLAKRAALGLAADQAEKAEIAAPEHLRADLQIQRMAVGHDEIEAHPAARRSLRPAARQKRPYDIRPADPAERHRPRPSIQVIRKGSGASARTSAFPTCPAPNRNRLIAPLAGGLDDIKLAVRYR